MRVGYTVWEQVLMENKKKQKKKSGSSFVEKYEQIIKINFFCTRPCLEVHINYNI